MNIGWLRTDDNPASIDGGNVYSRKVMDALSKEFSLDMSYSQINTGNKLIKKFVQLSRPLTISGKQDVWIRNFWSTITLPLERTKGKNLLLFFHLDSSVRSHPRINGFMERLFYRNIKKLDYIVTISEYWRKHFEDLGCENVKKIYYGLEPDEFKFTEKEIDGFKKRHNLTEKPIIYIGNCQRAKGVVNSYNELKDLDVYLVTSGKRRVEIPAINLDLEYKDYLRLLKASSVVVAMSKFKEGWGITPHEAMMCKTPVVGSGLGSYTEVLSGGKQVICTDFKDLKYCVETILKNPELSRKMGEDGYNWGGKFTNERFNKAWVDLFKEIESTLD